jgi:tape measure domain-containing protein
MATENLELNIVVTGAGAGAAQIDRLTKSAQSSLNIMRLMRNVLVAASFLRASEGIFTLINSFQLMQQQLLIVTGNVRDASASFQLVFQIAQQARSPLDAVNTLFQRMVRTGGTMNLTYKQVADVTRAVAESFTIAGASADETHNAIIQLTQGLNLGILRGQDLRSVIEFNPVLAQAFADKLYSLGLTVDKY